MDKDLDREQSILDKLTVFLKQKKKSVILITFLILVFTITVLFVHEKNIPRTPADPICVRLGGQAQRRFLLHRRHGVDRPRFHGVEILREPSRGQVGERRNGLHERLCGGSQLRSQSGLPDVRSVLSPTWSLYGV